RQTLAQSLIEQQHATGDSFAGGGVAVLLGDAEESPKQPEHRQERDRLAVRDSGGFVGHQSARAASFQELEAQAALAQPRFADDSDHLRITLPRARERRLEYLHLVAASDEAREPSRARHIEAGAHLPEPYQLV